MISRWQTFRKNLSILFWTPQCLYELQRVRNLKAEKINDYQEKKIRAIIKHSYDNVWYYNQLFKQANITPNDIQTLNDLDKIPI